MGRNPKPQKELKVQSYIRIPDREENKDASTYWERIEPTLMTLDEYFATVEPKEKWLKRRLESFSRNICGVEAEVTVLP